jgi:hypothetical protein
MKYFRSEEMAEDSLYFVLNSDLATKLNISARYISIFIQFIFHNFSYNSFKLNCGWAIDNYPFSYKPIIIISGLIQAKTMNTTSGQRFQAKSSGNL